MRQRMGSRRTTQRVKAKIGGQTVYAEFGMRPDASLGEIWITVAKCGSFVRGVLDSLARMTSLALQHGVPVAEVAATLRGMDFEPNGPVSGDTVATSCTSIVDYVAQEIEACFNRS